MCSVHNGVLKKFFLHAKKHLILEVAVCNTLTLNFHSYETLWQVVDIGETAEGKFSTNKV